MKPQLPRLPHPKINARRAVILAVFFAWIMLGFGLILMAIQDNETIGTQTTMVGFILLVWIGIPALIKFVPWKDLDL